MKTMRTANINFGGLKMEVEYYHQPEEKATRDYPGCAEAVEIERILIPSPPQPFATRGDELDMDILTNAAIEKIEDIILDRIRKAREQAKIDRADWEYHRCAIKKCPMDGMPCHTEGCANYITDIEDR
jgi:hypothetical protein